MKKRIKFNVLCEQCGNEFPRRPNKGKKLPYQKCPFCSYKNEVVKDVK